jgi:hypothetical protein
MTFLVAEGMFLPTLIVMMGMHRSYHGGSSLCTDVTENILSTFSCRVHTMVTDDENDCCVLREKVESERLSHHLK